jgi:hypothetical protein
LGLEVKKVTQETRKQWQELWEMVWREEGYDQPDGLSAIRKHYGNFDPHSTDLILTCWGWPIGTARVIQIGPPGLPVLNDFDIDPELKKSLLPMGKEVVEVTLLTLHPKARGLLLPFLLLLKGVYKTAKEMGAEVILMAADMRLYMTLLSMFPLTPLGQPKIYEGSLTVPACLSLREAEDYLAKHDPALLRFFTS